MRFFFLKSETDGVAYYTPVTRIVEKKAFGVAVYNIQKKKKKRLETHYIILNNEMT